MKTFCIFGLVLAVCVASNHALIDPKHDILTQLKNAADFGQAPKPEELLENLGGLKGRLARSNSFSGSFVRFCPYGGYGGYGGEYCRFNRYPGFGGYGSYGGYGGLND